MACGKDKTDKLVRYIKEDRPKKFKACVKKYQIDVCRSTLPKGRTYLHYAAQFGSGSLIDFLLKNGVDASKANRSGDLPLHVAIARALKVHSSDASSAYFDIVMPLLEAYPLALDVDDHHGDSGQELLKTLKRHLKKQDHASQPAGSHSYPSPDAEWRGKLAREFESESADFFGRYNDEDDFAQESQRETHNEWTDRMWREGHGRHHQSSIRLSNREGRKRPQAPDTDAGPSTAKKSTLDEEELKKARAKMQEAYRLREEMKKQNQHRKKRTAYEAHYQKVLTENNGVKLSFSEIPWPSSGSMQSVMDVLFSDLGIKCKTALKKYVRQQQVRWHPDKFIQKFGERVEEKSRKRVLERVKQISQAINKKAETMTTDDS